MHIKTINFVYIEDICMYVHTYVHIFRVKCVQFIKNDENTRKTELEKA